VRKFAPRFGRLIDLSACRSAVSPLPQPPGRDAITDAMAEKTAVIVGAGPAGLTAAFELLERSDIRPVVLEKSTYMGGLSRTVNYKGNRIDIGGHRFFSKSDRVMEWWLRHLPLERTADPTLAIAYQRKARLVAGSPAGPDPAAVDRVMLVRERKSRIYFLRKLFAYPIALNADTLRKLGVLRTVRIALSYAKAVLRPIRGEQNLEEFLINRFGRELYLTFFKSYTEKVWGTSCREISAEWGAQRIKGLSITRALAHFVRKAVFGKGRRPDLSQKTSETSLIERFLYPKHGPGQMWEEVARKVTAMGGEIVTEAEVRRVHVEGRRVVGVSYADGRTGAVRRLDGDWFFSTMPVKELVRALDCEVPAAVREISEGLVYRDFITVGLLLERLAIRDDKRASTAAAKLVKDNWIYIQEPDVLLGRLQIFNNWSPFMVSDPDKVWVGLEYFCYEGDELWRKSDEEMVALAKEELHRIGILERPEALDATVIRMPKTYPAYFGAYERFGEVREYLDGFENLFLVGRNGMHRYNNQDHSILTAMTAVDNIVAEVTAKGNVWAVNTEQEYHESKSG
jgi:protoporphyrinogen oxidase